MVYITTQLVVPISVIDLEYAWLFWVSVTGRLLASRFVACPTVSVFDFVSCLEGRSRCFQLVMSLPGQWPLSHAANKASCMCSVCRAVRRIHVKDGTVHRHGSRNSSCPGSDLPPLAAAAAPETTQPVSRSQHGPNLPPWDASSMSTATPGPHHQYSNVLHLIQTISLLLAKRLWLTSHPIFEP